LKNWQALTSSLGSGNKAKTLGVQLSLFQSPQLCGAGSAFLQYKLLHLIRYISSLVMWGCNIHATMQKNQRKY